MDVNEAQRLFILAGSMEQANRWAITHNVSNRYWVYVNAESALRGYSNPIYVVVGTFLTEHIRVFKIIEQLRVAQSQLMDTIHLQLFQSLSDKHLIKVLPDDAWVISHKKTSLTYKTIHA